jgi:hypothetical protein
MMATPSAPPTPAVHGGLGGAGVGLGGDAHADEAGDGRADGARDEGKGGRQTDAEFRLLRAEVPDDAEENRDEDRDIHVFALEEGACAGLNRVGNFDHRGVAAGFGGDLAPEVNDEGQRGHTRQNRY